MKPGNAITTKLHFKKASGDEKAPSITFDASAITKIITTIFKAPFGRYSFFFGRLSSRLKEVICGIANNRVPKTKFKVDPTNGAAIIKKTNTLKTSELIF